MDASASPPPAAASLLLMVDSFVGLSKSVVGGSAGKQTDSTRHDYFLLIIGDDGIQCDGITMTVTFRLVKLILSMRDS